VGRPGSQSARLLCVFALLTAIAVSPRANAQKSRKAAPTADASDSGPALTFTQVFKSSYPEYIQIIVDQEGKGTWDIRQLDDQPSPQPLQIDVALAQKMFALAANLHDFQGADLDVHRRIANLGTKTFEYKNGAAENQVTFNFTNNPDAQQLQAIFDGLERQELDLSDMQRVVRYDHLGVNDVILRVQNDVKRKLIPEPAALLPALDEIASNNDLIDMSRQRARAIAEQIRQTETKN
jgi:hypothetical protein